MNQELKSRSGGKRWIMFNAVGLIGILVQLSTLFVLTSSGLFGYLPATVIAVETAVLHNFLWHERWTWADRTKTQGGFARRLLVFHFANGAVSIIGNLLLMRLLVGTLELPFLPANALAIALCSVFNFLAGDRLVFRTPGGLSIKGDAGNG